MKVFGIILVISGLFSFIGVSFYLPNLYSFLGSVLITWFGLFVLFQMNRKSRFTNDNLYLKTIQLLGYIYFLFGLTGLYFTPEIFIFIDPLIKEEYSWFFNHFGPLNFYLFSSIFVLTGILIFEQFERFRIDFLPNFFLFKEYYFYILTGATAIFYFIGVLLELYTIVIVSFFPSEITYPNSPWHNPEYFHITISKHFFILMINLINGVFIFNFTYKKWNLISEKK
jgi:hypothetical protein